MQAKAEALAEAKAAAALAAKASADEPPAKVAKLLPPSPKAPAPKAMPAEPVVPALSIDEMRASAHDAAHRELDPMFVVRAEDSFQSSIVDSGDMQQARTLMSLVGNWFMVPDIQMHGKCVWKSIPELRSHVKDTTFYCFHTEEGWYFAEELFHCDADRQKLSKLFTREVEVLAWASTSQYEPDEPYPKTLHFPCWAKKPCLALKTMSLWESTLDLDIQIQMLMEELAKATQVAADGGAAASSTIQPKTPDYAPPAVQAEAVPAEGADATWQSNKRGGWLPRVARLAYEITQENWGVAKDLIAEWKNRYDSLNWLLEHPWEIAGVAAGTKSRRSW